jgi:hypothetical protein
VAGPGRMLRMDANKLFEIPLGVGNGWPAVKSDGRAEAAVPAMAGASHCGERGPTWPEDSVRCAAMRGRARKSSSTRREALQDVLAREDEEGLRWWCRWAMRSRLEPFRKLAKTIRAY